VVVRVGAEEVHVVWRKRGKGLLKAPMVADAFFIGFWIHAIKWRLSMRGKVEERGRPVEFSKWDPHDIFKGLMRRLNCQRNNKPEIMQ
jgi:hypothetical protein